MKGFNTSKDYDSLWSHIQNGIRVPGWLKARDGKISIVEIKLNSSKAYVIGTRGYGYGSYKNDKDSFKEDCQFFGLEYITPKQL